MSFQYKRTYKTSLWSLSVAVSLVIGILITTFMAVQAAGNVYYVSPSGSDTNDGRSLTTPFRTIQKCADVVIAGDTCLIRGGTYRETVVVQASGTADLPIKFQNYNNESAIISGADIITNTNWTLFSGNIYETPMNWSLNIRTSGYNVDSQITNDQIFIDGQMMVEARWPNIPIEKVTLLTNDNNAQATDAIIISTTAATYSDPALSAFPVNYWQGAKINFGPGGNSAHTTCDVTSSETTSVSFQCNPDPGANNTYTSWELPPGDDTYRPVIGNYYYLWGKLNALDSPGEWFREGSDIDGTLYAWMPDSSVPSNHIIEARKRLWSFDLRNQSYITIDGLKFFASTFRTGDYKDYANHLVIQNIEARYLWHFQEMPPLFWEEGYFGIDFGGDDNVLRDSYLAYSSGSIIRLFGQRNHVYNNVIQNGGYMGSTTIVSGNFVHFSSPGGVDSNYLEQNTIFNGGNTLVNAWLGLNIINNDLYNSHVQISDLGTIYGYAVDGNDAEIAYNLVHDNWAELDYGLKYWGGMGIFMDNDTRNFIVHHNIIWNTTSCGLYTLGVDLSAYPSGSNNKFYNNTVDGGIGAQAKKGNGFNQTLLGVEFKNNYATASDLADPDLILQNNREDYPLIVHQREQHDYFLRQDSPAIDAGVIIPGFTDNYFGLAPDIGAFEFGQPPFVAGAILRSQDQPELEFNCAANYDDTANCTIGKLPIGRKLPPDFQIRIGIDGLPDQNCFTQTDYTTSYSNGICKDVSTIGLSGTQPIYFKFGTMEWQNSMAIVDLDPLEITSITPPTGPEYGGIQVMLTGRRFYMGYSGYNIPITLTNNSGSPLYNYQVLVILNTAEKIAQGKMRPDCGDLRLNDTYSNLSYWLEDGCNTENTRIWVRVPVVSTGTSQIILSYGMPNFTSASDGQGTFVFFDGFNDGVIDLAHWWIDNNSGWFTVEETGGAMRIFGMADSNHWNLSVGFGLITDTITMPISFAIDSDLSTVQSPANFKATIGSQDLMLYGGGNGDYKNIGFWESGIGWTKLGQSTINTGIFTWKKFGVTYNRQSTDFTVSWFENGSLTDILASRTVPNPLYGIFRYSPDTIASFDVQFDNIRIRNFTFPEPTVSVGVESPAGVRVNLDDRPCVNIIVLRGNNLTCIIPDHPQGIVDVNIANPDGQTFTLMGGFTYFKDYLISLPIVFR